MGRRPKLEFARLALLVAGPLAVLWGISLWLHARYLPIARRLIGADANPAELDRLATQLVTKEMNGWLGAAGFPFAVLLVALLWAAIHLSFSLPHGRARRLRTRRLVLRRICPGDTDAFHAILSDPATLRYWDHAPHQAIEETARFLDDTKVDPNARDEFAILREGQVIGLIGTRQWPWVTYLIANAESGKGYGGEALKAFADYAFTRGIEALFVATDARNTASLAMVRRRGFCEIERRPITHPTGETIEGVLLRLRRPARRWPWLRRVAKPDKAVA